MSYFDKVFFKRYGLDLFAPGLADSFNQAVPDNVPKSAEFAKVQKVISDYKAELSRKLENDDTTLGDISDQVPIFVALLKKEFPQNDL